MRLSAILGVAGCVVVAVGVVLAFLALGTPNHARVVALDNVRVGNLDTMAFNMHGVYIERGALPARLPEDVVLRDPVTHNPYEYQRLDKKHFQLCGSFGAPSEPEETAAYGYGETEKWRHSVGRNCYQFDASQSPPITPHRTTR